MKLKIAPNTNIKFGDFVLCQDKKIRIIIDNKNLSPIRLMRDKNNQVYSVWASFLTKIEPGQLIKEFN